MRKLLGAMVTSSICLMLGFGTTGCTPKPKDKKELAIDAVSLTSMKKEDKATLSIKVKHGTISEFSIAPKDKGVEIEKDGTDGVKLTIKKADDATEKEYTVKLTGKGDDGKDKTLEHKVTVAQEIKKEEVKKVDKKDDKKDDKKVDDKKIDDKKVDKKDDKKVDDKKVDDKKDDKKVDDKKVDDKKVDDKKDDKKVDDKKVDDKKAPAAVLDLLVDESTLPKDLTLTETITIKFKQGEVASVDVDPKDKGVSAEFKKDWIKITVAKDAKDGEVKITVKAEKAKSVEWKFKVKVAPAKAGFLDDRNNDQRIPSTVRQLAVISPERFVAMNRRM